MAQVVHISEEEAARDVKALFERVREGERIRVESSGRACVMIVSEEPVESRSVSAIIEGLMQREENLRPPDEDFVVAEARKRSESAPEWERRTIAEARAILRVRREAQGLAVPDPDFATDMDAVRAITNARWTIPSGTDPRHQRSHRCGTPVAGLRSNA